MSVAAQILIAAQTAAANSQALQRSAADGQCTVAAVGLAGAETVGVQILGADGTTWGNVLVSPSIQLTATNNTCVLPGPGIYRFVKSVTAATVGVVAYSI